MAAGVAAAVPFNGTVGPAPVDLRIRAHATEGQHKAVPVWVRGWDNAAVLAAITVGNECQ